MYIFLAILFFILGVCFGSFTNVLIYRMPEDISVVKRAKSFCPKCGHEIKWYDNIPLISYLVLRGKCRNCKEKISIRYPLVELAGGVIFLTTFLVFGDINIQSLVNASLLSIILIIAFAIAYIDEVSCLIPTSLCVTIFVISLVYFGYDLYLNIVNHTMLEYNSFYDKIVAFGGVIIKFMLIYVLAKFVFKREAMGLGDVILLASMAPILGSAKLFMTVLFASVSCSILELILIATKVRKRDQELPFGPYIVFGFYLSIFFGDAIINGIMNLF